MRTFLLLASIACAFVAFLHSRGWAWLGIDPYVWDMYSWALASLGLLGAAQLPWGTRFRYWFDRGNR